MNDGVSAVRGNVHTSDAFWRYRLGVARAHVDQIVAGSVSSFDPGSEQMSAVGHKADDIVADSIVGERSGLARPGRNQYERPSLSRSGDGPLVIWGDRPRKTFTNLDGWRTVRVAKIDGVIRSTAIAFFFEQNLMPVAADVAHNRPAKPSQFALFLRTGPHATNANPGLVPHH